MKLGERVALGFRAHSGWSVVVAAARSRGRFVVVERRRIVTADNTKQPYHAAERLEFAKAEPLIRKCRENCAALATDAVSALIAELAQSGYSVVRAAILYASGRPLPDLCAILQSHALIHTAEGEFFREVLACASEHCRLPVTKVKEKEVWERAGAALCLDSAALQTVIAEVGRSLGPPWRQDEKLASLAAWIALAN
jgi:hypothetical protein